jgi:hypothetical protein
LRQRIAFAGVNSFVFSNCDIDDIIKNGVITIKDRVDVVEDQIISEEKIYFNPSRTAQNGINFVTRDLIDELKRCDYESIKDMFRLLYILGNEDYNNHPNLIKHFFDNIGLKNLTFSKFFIKNLGEYMLRKLHMKVNFALNKRQITEFKKIVDGNEIIFNQNEIYKICKPASYMIYYLKEMNEYIEKVANGDLDKINEVKKLRRELTHLNKDEAFYSKYI